jgi:hypothetical protein
MLSTHLRLVRWRAAEDRRPEPESIEEIEERNEELDVTLLHDIEANFYGAFVIALVAALESSLTNTCEYVKRRQNSRLSLSDLREPSSVKRALLYLEVVSRRPVSVSETRLRELRNLQNVRNALAHANGHMLEQRAERVRELESFAAGDSCIVIVDSWLVVQPAMLEYGMRCTSGLLTDLLVQLDRQYPSPGDDEVGK